MNENKPSLIGSPILHILQRQVQLNVMTSTHLEAISFVSVMTMLCLIEHIQ